MKKLLWISYMVPFDTVKHAGGKLLNYYLKEINKKSVYDIYFMSIARDDEISFLDFQQYNISADIAHISNTSSEKITRFLMNLSSRYNYFDKYASILPGYIRNIILKKCKLLGYNGYKPDIIILEWTAMGLLSSELKKIFPSAKFVISEVDVSLLGFKRKFEYETNFFRKKKLEHLFHKLETKEINSLNNVNLVVLNNYKDKKLLEDYNVVTRKFVICPYFYDMTSITRRQQNKDILFYGAMNRKENYLSAIWFIENVLYKLLDPDIRFVILGANPDEVLNKYANEKVIIKGFVDDIVPFFENSMCLVAPLVLGAGVKIKILEALSSGICVLTNEIGIEGIPAEEDKDFFLCNSANDYINIINKLLNDDIDIREIEVNAKNFISSYYKVKLSVDNYIKELNKL